MSYSIFPTQRFEKELKRLSKKYPSIKTDFAALIQALLQNPKSGTALGNSIYKVRMSISSKGKGKSGGARVLTYVYSTNESIYLLSIYDKSERESISIEELKEVISLISFED